MPAGCQPMLAANLDWQECAEVMTGSLLEFTQCASVFHIFCIFRIYLPGSMPKYCQMLDGRRESRKKYAANTAQERGGVTPVCFMYLPARSA